MCLTFVFSLPFLNVADWSYMHGLYYGFTTLTTIGFGDYVALQQDNSLQRSPEYVTFVLVFIMFGLAFIACVLNLLVLKFLTLNTEDERRDENQAIEVRNNWPISWFGIHQTNHYSIAKKTGRST